MIHLENLSFAYRKGHPVLRRIDLDLPMGSVVGLLGRNGEGKSTLLKTLCGQLFPTAGTIDVLGFCPKSRQVSFLQQVYFLPEEVQVPAITIGRYFDLFAPLYPSYDPAIGEELLANFQLSREMNLGKISQGQKKKALIAFALSLQVPLLLLDEPTNGLDIPSKGEFRRAVARYTSERQTIIISTHQVRDLEQLIDRLMILEGGEILCAASIGDLSERLYCGPLSPSQEAEAFYSEPSPVGNLGIAPVEGASHEGIFSMELFFNALIAGQRTALLDYLRGASSSTVFTHQN